MGVFRRILGTVALLALLVVEASAAGATHSPPARSPAGLSFATPEEGIAYFASAISRGDSAAALEAFALDEQLANLNFIRLGKRLGQVSLRHGPSPERYEFYLEINRARLLAQAAMQIRDHVYSLLLPPGAELDQIRIQPNADIEVSLTEIEATLDPGRLRSLKLLQAGRPLPHIVTSDSYKKVIDGQRATYGADDMQEWAALYELDGAMFAAGFTFLRYGNGWQIVTLGGPLANLPATGQVVPTNEVDFQKLLE